MEEIKINELMEVIEYEEKSLDESAGREEEDSYDEIRVYEPPRVKKKKTAFLRFIVLTFAFFLLFLCIGMMIKEKQTSPSDSESGYLPTVMIPETTTICETTGSVMETVYTPVVIDESKISAEINFDEKYSLNSLIKASEGVKIVILHSHNSEYVSDSISVSDAGDVISQLFTSAGLETYHCVTVHDKEGSLGAYSRMKESLTSILEKYPATVCVIDIHDSDSGLPVTFTVGTDGAGWNENLRLAQAICGRMTGIETAFRFLPGSLGQDSGILTINIGIGNGDCSESEARAAISSFAQAFIETCNEKASAP